MLEKQTKQTTINTKNRTQTQGSHLAIYDHVMQRVVTRLCFCVQTWFAAGYKQYKHTSGKYTFIIYIFTCTMLSLGCNSPKIKVYLYNKNKVYA